MEIDDDPRIGGEDPEHWPDSKTTRARRRDTTRTRTGTGS
jgi:hypothetical protein